MLLSFVVKEEVGEVHLLLLGRAKCFLREITLKRKIRRGINKHRLVSADHLTCCTVSPLFATIFRRRLVTKYLVGSILYGG